MIAGGTAGGRADHALFSVSLSRIRRLAVDALALSFVMLARPCVAVTVQSDEPREAAEMKAWLSVRLLEEGFDLGPSPTRADVQVTVSERVGGTQVDAQGAKGRRSWAVEAGPPSVHRLEVLHRALLGVDAVADDVALPRGPALSVRFSGEVDEAMLGAIVGSASARGITVAAEAEPGDTLACVAVRGDVAEIGLGPAEDGCAAPSLVVSPATSALLAGESVVAEVAPALAPPSPDPYGDIVLPPPPPARVETTAPSLVEDYGDPVAMHGAPRAEARFGVDGGIAVRKAVDAMMRAFVRLGKYEGLGGRLELSVIPSGSTSVRVVDTVLMVGPDWQIDLHRRVRLHLGAIVGTDVQTYVVASSAAADVGWSAGIPVELSIDLRNDTRLHIATITGMSGVARSHSLGDEIHWERAPWRVGVALGFSHGWRIE